MTFDNTQPHPEDAVSLAELDLYHQIMEYRAQNNLPAIPLSEDLTTTAGRHAADTIENIWNTGLVLPAGANLHSWSDAPYFSDHSQAQVMWGAPQRVGTNYPGDGFEISAAGQTSTADALAGWKSSPGHNNVILNQDIWAAVDFSAVGVGVMHDPNAGGPFGGYIYHVWFGREADDASPVISGTAGDETIEGTAFGDTIQSGGGNDTVVAGNGDDDITTGAGRDRVKAGGGDDTASGGGGKDRMNGQGGNDELNGDGGRDKLKGNGGQDNLQGGGGRDQLSGGGGADTLNGGGGNDILRGQGGPDQFVFSGKFGNDTIKDFKPAADTVAITTSGEAADGAAFLAALTDTPDGALYDAGSDGKNTILFEGVSVSEMSEDVFVIL